MLTRWSDNSVTSLSRTHMCVSLTMCGALHTTGTWQAEPCEATFPYARLQKLFERKNYFWIQVGSRLFYNTNPENVSIHFGRELYARAVQNPKLVDWKNCVTDEKTETAATEQFKTRFKPFDKVFQ